LPPDSAGYKIVLTADPTLMADYRLLFDATLVSNQTTVTPELLVRALMLPYTRSPGLRARTAPLGLRRVEAALLRAGFSTDDVIVVHPDNLPHVIGPDTLVIGVSTGEPAGLGLSSTTIVAITGGRSFPAAMFQKMMRRIRLLRSRSPRARVIAGGPGSWQLAAQPDLRRSLGIDHVVTGYCEGNVVDIFNRLIAAEPLPEELPGSPVSAGEIPPITRASSMGVTELSRGCGLGCAFCTLARTPMLHIPPETILTDVRTNLATGIRDVCVISEDAFRYGGQGLEANPQALIALLEQVRAVEGVRLIQTDHANILSLSQYSDADLARVRALMVGSTGQRFPWVNIGVETASSRLLQANGGFTKMGPGIGADWPALCAEQLRRFARAGFLPTISIILGMPGETDDDIRVTLDWMRSMSAEPLVAFPLLYAPIDGSDPVTRKDLRPLHWQLIRACFRLDLKWLPRLYRDNQRAGRVGLVKRSLMQMLGLAEMAFWRSMLVVRSRSAGGRP